MKKQKKAELFAELNKVKRGKKSMRGYLLANNYQDSEIDQILAELRIFNGGLTDAKAPEVEDEPLSESPLAFHSDKYIYNKESDTYIVPLKCAPKPLVIKGEDHRAIIKNYSNWLGKGLSINEIARKFRMPRSYFNEYKTVFSLTHDREPLSAEEILSSDTGDSVDHILEEKRFAIHQKFEKEDWKRTQEEADKWRSLVAREFNPFEKFLEGYQPPVIQPLYDEGLINNGGSNEVFITGLSDLHFGLHADARYLFKGRHFSTQTICDVVDQYARKIAKTVQNRGRGFESVAIFCMGDILNGLRGKTERGTLLENDKLRDDQFDYAFDSLNVYISRMAEIFGKVELHSVRGNHDGLDNYILFKAIEAFFRTDNRIEFHNYSTRTALVRIKDVLFVLDHGESDTFLRCSVPAQGKARESYIQSLLLSNPDQLIGAKQKVFVQGHLHHFENVEMTDFEFLMLGSPVVGDKYSDHHNFNARPRQNCIVVNEDGISEILSFYFDNLTKR